MTITAPTPVLDPLQPNSGSTTTLELALCYDSTGVVIAVPAFHLLPVVGEIGLVFSPSNTMYPAYVASGLAAWDYAVKTGMAGTLTFKTAAPATDVNIGALVKAGLGAGSAAVALFRVKNADGTYYSGTCVLGLTGTTSPVRGISENGFSGATSGQVVFSNA